MYWVEFYTSLVLFNKHKSAQNLTPLYFFNQTLIFQLMLNQNVLNGIPYIEIHQNQNEINHAVPKSLLTQVLLTRLVNNFILFLNNFQ